MYGIDADGIRWIDSDGNKSWPLPEAITLADDLETRKGYEVEMFEVIAG